MGPDQREIGINPGRDWQIYGLGDFFGDSDTDNILWQNSDGSPSIWDMKGQTIPGVVRAG